MDNFRKTAAGRCLVRAIIASLLCAGLIAFAGGCSKENDDSESQCLEQGTCECRDNSDCTAGRVCVDGNCLDSEQALTCEVEGTTIVCDAENEHGVCFGERVCLASGFYGECNAAIPAAEICDGQDNDCNGGVDDGIPVLPCEETNQHGTCSGEQICVAESGEICTATPPASELCDGVDNDCDGATDEDFIGTSGLYNHLEHCGSCGRSCTDKFANTAQVVCDDTGDTAFCRIESCADGYVKISDELCQTPGHHLCEPCQSDAMCGGPNDKCLVVDADAADRFCGRDCAPNNIYGVDCPAGYTCRTVLLDGLESQQCIPTVTSCDCTSDNPDQPRSCYVENEYGICYGVDLCDPDTGWQACTAATPRAETCNAADDNCNGLVDENLGGAPCSNTNSLGTCAGIEICDGNAEEIRCNAPAASAEVCDAIDNDCDGQIDEEYAINVTNSSGVLIELKYSLSDENCGGCGVACAAAAPATDVICDGAGAEVFCRVVDCESGYYAHEGRGCLPVPGMNLCLPCEHNGDCPGPDDQCLSFDDSLFCGGDCSEDSVYSVGTIGDSTYCTGTEGEQGCCQAGYLCLGGQCTPETLSCACDQEGKIRACENSNAHGLCAGEQTCSLDGVDAGVDAGWQPCGAAMPIQETCDGADNDCDGLVDMADDSIDLSGLADYPVCENVSSACPGVWSCAHYEGTTQWVCSAREPTDEVCNGRDDNCDGVTDEEFTNQSGQYDGIEHCGRCNLDCREAVANLSTDADGGVLAGAVLCALVETTYRCVPEECAPGLSPFPIDGTASVCFEPQAENCRPCQYDEECGLFGDQCVVIGSDDGMYCAQRCDTDAEYLGCTGALGEQGCCPAGFACQNVGGDLLCQPDSGSCQCSAVNSGLTRSCSAIGNGGTTICFGTSTCMDVGGGVYDWSSCDLSANTEVCDGLDNNCDGSADEGFTVGGEYTTDEHCGECGRDCDLAFDIATLHVHGVCDAELSGGPDCVVGTCASESYGGGTPCLDDTDCASDPAGDTCHAEYFQCGRTCTIDDDCLGDGVCRDSSCTVSCSSMPECQVLFGSTSACQEGVCVTDYTWANLDLLDGNGCECPVADALVLDEPEVFDEYPAAGAAYVDRNCDGVDGDVATALFVSSQSASGDGTLENPFPTIQEAIDAFQTESHNHILVASGLYNEQIILKGGVKIFGGYSLDFTRRDIVLLPTLIEAPEPDFSGAVVPGTVNAVGIDETTVVAGLIIQGYDITADTGAGKPSYAVYIASSSDELRIINNKIVGGRGGPGRAGIPGSSGSGGNGGQDGNDARECASKTCSGENEPGGSGGSNSVCPTAMGCPGMEAEPENPQVADNPPPPSGCTYANGGAQSSYTGSAAMYCKYDCNIGNPLNGPSGSDASDGSDGSGGEGCAADHGSVSGDEWAAGVGTTGVAGGYGSGGQGGSSGGWVENDKSESCMIGNLVGDLGGTGGGGGSGGCGGSGGSSGQSGGASLAVFIASGSDGSYVNVSANRITQGRGGDGGDGGNGGAGGPGGRGGGGGGSGWPAWCAGLGGAGGRGGDGGDAGGGGGGCGGPSFSVAGASINAAQYESNNSFTVSDGASTGGAGGAGGLSLISENAGTSGSIGASKNTYSF